MITIEGKHDGVWIERLQMQDGVLGINVTPEQALDVLEEMSDDPDDKEGVYMQYIDSDGELWGASIVRIHNADPATPRVTVTFS